MIDKNKQYRTRDGREVRIYATDGSGNDCVHGAYGNNSKGWHVTTWDAQGQYLGPYVESVHDLIEVKPRYRIEQWVNVYPDNIVLHTTRKGAEMYRAVDCLATRRIVIEGEEGQDDE